MTQPPDRSERPDGSEPEPTSPFLAKPASPSGDDVPTAPQPTQVQPQPPYAPYAPGYPPPGAPGAYPFTQSHSGANTALTLGIISLVCAVFSFTCLTIPGILCGPFAIYFGIKAQREIGAQPGRYGNQGAAVGGLVCGIVGTVIGLLMVALLVFVFGTFFGILGLFGGS
ncbi:hypothetical protein GCM10023340_12250 [Nocardioides marinquilinus]|uniref:DUF4190 domain-containing protein n=1 Tax=Nocardioides marinquilinus TaxID=1210400 RepID=A0ABP9PCS4_9ACTN